VGEEGVYPGGVGSEEGVTRCVTLEGLHLGGGSAVPAENAGEAIIIEAGWPNHFTEATQSHTALNVHLEEPILRVHIPLGEEEVGFAARKDMGNPPAIAHDLNVVLQARKGQASLTG
jgi:hypothetical protein